LTQVFAMARSIFTPRMTVKKGPTQRKTQGGEDNSTPAARYALTRFILFTRPDLFQSST
jgi:hypothetical protein